MLRSSPGALLSSPENRASQTPDVSALGFDIKCVASNVRFPHIDWDRCELTNGVGQEGNLVVVESLGNDSDRDAVENQYGYDEPIGEKDRFIAILANRHSGTSESGFIPDEGLEINPKTELDLLAAGGIVGISSGMPSGAKSPMRLRPIGLVANQDGPLDLLSLHGTHDKKLNSSSPVILVCGTSAEVGKTTSSISLIEAMVTQGVKVSGTKISGTGRMRDILNLQSAGATPALDFPEVGLATTYTSTERYIPGMYTLFNYLNKDRPDVIVAEAGGDPIEANVPAFLSDEALSKAIGAIILVAGDVMGMMGAIDYIRKYDLDAPIYLTDPKGRNPVTTRERVAQELPGHTIFNSLDPSETAKIANKIMESLTK